ncbi:hypothetical protein IGI04_040040, partial [Brassica rapa subsp. trilocularis]
AGKPKSSFVSIPKRIHTISPRERLYRLTRPFGELDRVNCPTRRMGKVDRMHRPTCLFGELDPSNSHNGRVGPNKSSKSPVRQVGSTNLSLSRPLSFLLRDQIELALVSSRS